jgi:hypothetical protein
MCHHSHATACCKICTTGGRIVKQVQMCATVIFTTCCYDRPSITIKLNAMLCVGRRRTWPKSVASATCCHHHNHRHFISGNEQRTHHQTNTRMRGTMLPTRKMLSLQQQQHRALHTLQEGRLLHSLHHDEAREAQHGNPAQQALQAGREGAEGLAVHVEVVHELGEQGGHGDEQYCRKVC